MLDTGRLEECIDELGKSHNDELQEKELWEMWLHKEFEGQPTWEQFRNRYMHPEQYRKPDKQAKMDDFEAIVKT